MSNASRPVRFCRLSKDGIAFERMDLLPGAHLPVQSLDKQPVESATKGSPRSTLPCSVQSLDKLPERVNGSASPGHQPSGAGKWTASYGAARSNSTARA